MGGGGEGVRDKGFFNEDFLLDYDCYWLYDIGIDTVIRQVPAGSSHRKCRYNTHLLNMHDVRWKFKVWPKMYYLLFVSFFSILNFHLLCFRIQPKCDTSVNGILFTTFRFKGSLREPMIFILALVPQNSQKKAMHGELLRVYPWPSSEKLVSPMNVQCHFTRGSEWVPVLSSLGPIRSTKYI
jgi:hypothetical protein